MGVSLPGLASGLDTATLITKLMGIEKIPYNNLQVKKTNIDNNKSVFNNINLKLKTLRDAATNLSDLDSFKVNGGTSSDPSKVAVTVGDNAISGNYTIEVSQLAKPHVIAMNSISVLGSDGKDASFDFETYKDNVIKVNGKEIKFSDLELDGKTTSEALVEIASAINKSDSGVQASVIQTKPGEKSLVLTAKESGEDHEITTDLSNSTLFSVDNNAGQPAQNAELIVNGVKITSSSNTIKAAVPGMTFQLLAEKSTVSVEVKQDVDKITSKIDAFVKAYNEVIDIIKENTKKITNEKDANGEYKNFKTNLQGDSLLRDLQNELYGIVSSVGANGNSDGFKLLSQIGLEIDKGVTSAALMTGKISFDKELFKEKIAEDPVAVEELFRGDNGLGVVAKDRLKDWTSVNGLIQMKMDGYQSQIDFITDQMESMNERLILKEDALNKKFTAMEVALSKLQSQQSWMTTQLNSMIASSKSNS
ncbi:flagellar filament capping protein FliD [Paenibacillus motobuensis]|uniref:Flagellar hook-associated protein 2 n=2 Tax=Paenibacillus motobuensis TaxID=295324 RepID=A0ABP3HR81_9BACL